MGVIPSGRAEKIAFYKMRLEPWTTNAGDIGLTGPEMANMTALVEAAMAAQEAAALARTQSKLLTQAYYTAVSEMGTTGKGLVETIRTFAIANNNPNVYTLSLIPPPVVDTAIPPPGLPREFTVTLENTGYLTVKWKCTNPEGAAGTAYEVQRKIGGGSFVYIGIAGGDKTYVDSTLPAGSTGVVYQVTGVRSGLRGPAAQVNVNFGVGGAGGGGGFTVTSVTEGTDVKLAA
jgi:hypothetical protein